MLDQMDQFDDYLIQRIGQELVDLKYYVSFASLIRTNRRIYQLCHAMNIRITQGLTPQDLLDFGLRCGSLEIRDLALQKGASPSWLTYFFDDDYAPLQY